MEALSKVAGQPVAGSEKPDGLARGFAFRTSRLQRGLTGVGLAGQSTRPGWVGQFLVSIRLLCACCYCSRPGRLGGNSFA